MGVIRILTSGELYKLRKYRIYKGLLSDYKNNLLHPFRVMSIHRRGFVVSDWDILKLTKNNCGNYLTTKQYNSIHPINGYYSKIIDDKMVIKYVFSGTSLGKYMPDYYAMIDENGNVVPLMDAANPEKLHTFQGILSLLKEKEKLAIKLVTGSVGKGFYKAEYKNGRVLLNQEELSEEAFVSKIATLRNYAISEYLTTHPYLAGFWPETANTIRYLVGAANGEWRFLKSFIRFGSSHTGVVENFNAGGVLCYLDENGSFSNGYMIKKVGKKRAAELIDRHPETNKQLKGQIPLWDEVKKCTEGIEKLLPQTNYLGLDYVITDQNKVKLLEINSLTSLDALQLDGSILETENGRWFFSSLFEESKNKR